MAFTEFEILQIQEVCKANPLIAKVWLEFNRKDEDTGRRFQKSLKDAVNALSDELDSIHSGKYNKFRILNSDSKVYKRVYQLLTNSKKIMDALEQTKMVKSKTSDPVNDQLFEELNEEAISFTDREANKKNKK